MEWLHPDFDNLETEPEPVILYKLLTAFGPPPDALISHVAHEQGESLLQALWQGIEAEDLYDPFEQWTETTYPNLDGEAKRLILRMTHLDPAKRATMAEIMEDPYWGADGGYHVPDSETPLRRTCG